jgi:hypothetical protein
MSVNEETVSKQLERTIKELHAVVVTQLTVLDWNAIESVIRDFKPGNDGQKNANRARALRAIIDIRSAKQFAIDNLIGTNAEDVEFMS